MVKMANCFEQLYACCFGQTNDRDPPYQPLHSDGATDGVVPVRSHHNRNFSESADDIHSASPQRQLMDNDVRQDGAAQARQNEDEELNAILDYTQQNIIDVSHLDNVEMPSGDFVNRQKKYEEAVKGHDLKLGRTSVNGKTSVAPGGLSGQLLEDAGNRVPDYLGRPPLSQSRVASICDSAARIEAVIKDSLKIETTKQLVVFMDK